MANNNTSRGGGSRTILVILILLVLAAIAAWALGLFSVSQTDQGALPSVQINAQGGDLPSFDVDAADIDVGTTNTTVEVPTVEVQTKETTVEVPSISVNKAQ